MYAYALSKYMRVCKFTLSYIAISSKNHAYPTYPTFCLMIHTLTKSKLYMNVGYTLHDYHTLSKKPHFIGGVLVMVQLYTFKLSGLFCGNF
jgi:hypothetical protein